MRHMMLPRFTMPRDDAAMPISSYNADAPRFRATTPPDADAELLILFIFIAAYFRHYRLAAFMLCFIRLFLICYQITTADALHYIILRHYIYIAYLSFERHLLFRLPRLLTCGANAYFYRHCASFRRRRQLMTFSCR